MPYFLVTFDTPSPQDLAQELGQRLLGKQLAKGGFAITTFGSLAIIEFPDSGTEFIDKVQSEAQAWISDKHRSLRMRKLSGKRQAQNLGMPTEPEEVVVCLEIRK
jgi:hypothetical protein